MVRSKEDMAAGKLVVKTEEEDRPPPYLTELKGGDVDKGEQLESFLGPEFIAERPGPGGTKLSYVAGHRVISIANAIFGWDRWSSEIKCEATEYLEKNEEGLWMCAVSSTMRVTVRLEGDREVWHEDVGCGVAERMKDPGMAVQKAKKEASTDALKRALRQFGEALGNCLYNKQYLAWVKRKKMVRSVHSFEEEELFMIVGTKGRKRRKMEMEKCLPVKRGSLGREEEEKGKQEVDGVEDFSWDEDGDVDF